MQISTDYVAGGNSRAPAKKKYRGPNKQQTAVKKRKNSILEELTGAKSGQKNHLWDKVLRRKIKRV